MNESPARGHHSPTEAVRIRIALGAEDLAAVRLLFEEYAAQLSFDLGFQNFAEELACLPGEYAFPEGRLFLAFEMDAAGRETEPLGCVGVRPCMTATESVPGGAPPRLGEVCEMKRLYVRPAGRGRGLGRLLAEKAVAAARLAGYDRMRLDTVPAEMARATSMYHAMGFVNIPPYRFNPQPDVAYLELTL